MIESNNDIDGNWGRDPSDGDRRAEDGVNGESNRKYSTGIEPLDRKLEGGLPYGTIVVLAASPASQSELLLYEFVAGRKTVYLTTERSESTVREVLETAGTESGDLDVRTIGGEEPLADARRTIDDLTETVALVIDPTRLFERQDEPTYRGFLNELETWTTETDSVAFLHCLEGRGVTDTRDLTQYRADVIFELATEVTGERVENSLAVLKYRGGQAFDDVIKLDLTSEVDIDISRKIA